MKLYKQLLKNYIEIGRTSDRLNTLGFDQLADLSKNDFDRYRTNKTTDFGFYGQRSDEILRFLQIHKNNITNREAVDIFINILRRLEHGEDNKIENEIIKILQNLDMKLTRREAVFTFVNHEDNEPNYLTDDIIKYIIEISDGNIDFYDVAMSIIHHTYPLTPEYKYRTFENLIKKGFIDVDKEIDEQVYLLYVKDKKSHPTLLNFAKLVFNKPVEKIIKKYARKSLDYNDKINLEESHKISPFEAFCLKHNI